MVNLDFDKDIVDIKSSCSFSYKNKKNAYLHKPLLLKKLFTMQSNKFISAHITIFILFCETQMQTNHSTNILIEHC